MPKATLEFNLPEEQDEYEMTMKAGAMHSAIWDFDQRYLRNIVKYGVDSDMVSKVKEMLKNDYLEEARVMPSDEHIKLLIEATAQMIRSHLYMELEDAGASLG